jgi:hypothetical protein
MRTGKIPAILAANATGIATPDVATFVFIYFESDSKKLCVKDSTSAVVKTAALTGS